MQHVTSQNIEPNIELNLRYSTVHFPKKLMEQEECRIRKSNATQSYISNFMLLNNLKTRNR